MSESGDCRPLRDNRQRALHVVQSLAAENGGTSVCVPALAKATAATGRYSNSLLHFSQEEVSVTGEGAGITIQREPSSSLGLLLPTSARAVLGREIGNTGIVHVHGIWTGHSSAAIQFASRLKRPVIVAAHGMLDEWALRQQRWKKVPYSMFVERPNLSTAACLHALTKVEAENYRAFGLRVPVAVIPNGVIAPDTASPEEFLDRYPRLRGKTLILFLGRLHKKKGVDLLVKAWEEVSPRFPKAHLVIAGPDDGALGPLSRFEGSGSESNAITVCGLLMGSLKWSAVAASSAFVLPSFSEGLSMATLEALSLGLPILITRGCNFREAESMDCTFLIEPTVSGIIAGLENVLGRSPQELQSRGARGASFVRARYSWPVVGAQMADLYDWVLGGPMPSTVEI